VEDLDQGLANYGHRSDPIMLIGTAKAIKRSKSIAFSMSVMTNGPKDPMWRKSRGDKQTALSMEPDMGLDPMTLRS